MLPSFHLNTKLFFPISVFLHLQRSQQQSNHHTVQLHLCQSDQAIHAVSMGHISNDFLIAPDLDSRLGRVLAISYSYSCSYSALRQHENRNVSTSRGLDTIFSFFFCFLLFCGNCILRFIVAFWCGGCGCGRHPWPGLVSNRPRNSFETLSRDSCLSISCCRPLCPTYSPSNCCRYLCRRRLPLGAACVRYPQSKLCLLIYPARIESAKGVYLSSLKRTLYYFKYVLTLLLALKQRPLTC